MTERETRTLPAFVWVAMIAVAVLQFADLAVQFSSDRFGWLGMRAFLASNAMDLTVHVVIAMAAAHLGRRLTGVAALGARIAVWALVLTIGMSAVREIYFAVGHGSEDTETILMYVDWGLGLVVAIGLVVAAYRSTALMIIGGVSIMFDNLPPAVWTTLWKGAAPGHVVDVVYAISLLLGMTGTVLLLYGAARGAERPQPSLAIRGFRLAARGVWLRVVVAIVAVCVTFMAAASGGSSKGLALALVAALVVNFASFWMFGIGAIQAACANLDGLPRFVLGLAGVLSLWCGSLMFIQAPELYSSLTGGAPSFTLDFLDPLSIAQPVVAMLAAALLAGGVGSFAYARADSGLARQARSAGVAFVGLTLFALFAQYALIEAAHSAGAVVLVMLVAAVCGLIAQVA
ncbi:MAG TPA: hypothetical protein VGO00_01470, partial [Kofleriaceae bacterium]|nr:hypothetical protein [Kofleriaceae bacterium]